MISNGQVFGYSIILGTVLMSAGCATIDGKPLYPLRIPPSHGDGEFHDISWRFPWPDFPIGAPVPGYVVKFPAFDLGKEYHHEFVVEGLHDLKQEVGVYLFIDAPWYSGFDDEIRQLQAEFEFEVLNTKGQIITHAKKPLSELTWSSPLGIKGFENGCALYSPEDSFFQVHKDERYTIRVVYRPDPAFHVHQGFVYLRCGGSI